MVDTCSVVGRLVVFYVLKAYVIVVVVLRVVIVVVIGVGGVGGGGGGGAVMRRMLSSCELPCIAGRGVISHLSVVTRLFGRISYVPPAVSVLLLKLTVLFYFLTLMI